MLAHLTESREYHYPTFIVHHVIEDTGNILEAALRCLAIDVLDCLGWWMNVQESQQMR
jgi:hypothetical protein